jgi:CrcB protein
MMQLLAVCAGGALGSLARYLVSVLAARLLGSDFPFGTIIVNLVGSFLIGLIQQVALSASLWSLSFRLFLTVGILGGFTTYSAFSYEAVQMAREGAWLQSTVYVAITTLFALTMCALGMLVGRTLIQ